jgi:hypothetical protein
VAAVKRPDDTEKRSIEELPGRQLFLGFSSSSTEDAFGIVNLAEVTEQARKYAYLDSDDIEAS